MIFWHCGLSPLSLPPLSTKNTEVFLTRAILRNPSHMPNNGLSPLSRPPLPAKHAKVLLARAILRKLL